MLRGIYSAANAMRYRAQEVDITANNIANVATDGFKQDRVALRSFDRILLSRISDLTEGEEVTPERFPLGSATIGGPVALTPFIDFSQGPPKITGNPLDLFLKGPGFLALETPAGVRYTRAGSFTLDPTGIIVNQNGLPLLGVDNQPIRITSPAPLTINYRGEIIQNRIPVGRIQIVEFPHLNLLEKDGATLFKPVEPSLTPLPARETTIEQGAIEMSNVDPINSLIQLIVAQRAYEAASRAVDIFNQSMTRVSGEIGRLPT